MKTILVLNSVPTRPGQENPKKKIARKLKNFKNILSALFLSKPGEIGREREKIILVPNSIPNRPEQENSKKNGKEIQKIKEIIPALFPSKLG